MSRTAAVVTFRWGGADYAFEIADVVEVTPLADLTPLPGSSPRVAGVTTWRGRTIPVIDLAALLKPEEEAPDLRKRLLVLGRPGHFGVLIDEPGRVLSLPGIPEPGLPGGDSRRGGRWESSVVRGRHGSVSVLDPERVLGSSRELLGGES